jgi:hypothetical protein
VHTEALAILVAVTTDFILNHWNLEILLYYRIWHIPWCVCYEAHSLRLEGFEDFYVGRGCCSPELYSIGPDVFEHTFVDKECVVCREL